MNLFERVSIKKTELKTRLVLPPMATAKSTPEGYASDALCDYYEKRAAGGKIGLIITEHSFVSKRGKASANQMSMASDDVIPGLRKLTETIHKYDTKVIAQINHAGSATMSAVTGSAIISASAVLNPGRKAGLADEIPESMTAEQIRAAEKEFADAAVRVKKAGFDGVEIHSAHGYLLNQFYSPLTNKRTDEYGAGSLENRLRIHKEILQQVREAVGEDYLIAVRFGGCDYMEGGSTIEEAAEAAKLLERYGADLLDISGGMCRFDRPGHKEAGYFSDLSKAVKDQVSVPVIVTGGIRTVEEANDLLEKEKADLIGVGRTFMKNPNWGN